MTNVQLLIGSLSNDLLRVAALSQRGSLTAASRFLHEAKKWSGDLEKLPTKMYIRKIVLDVLSQTESEISEAQAEKYLMYGVLLQNYSLHSK